MVNQVREVLGSHLSLESDGAPWPCSGDSVWMLSDGLLVAVIYK